MSGRRPRLPRTSLFTLISRYPQRCILDREFLEKILIDVADGKKNVNEALKDLKAFPLDDLGFANIDNHRGLRTGQGEVVFAGGKTTEQTAKIVEQMKKNTERILVTRADNDHYIAVKAVAADAVYYEDAREIVVGGMPESDEANGIITVVTAGTSDIPVAEEAAVTAEFFGNHVERIYDVGVAGIHRLFAKYDAIKRADVLIVIAGMEGALASVVGGLVGVPVVAVPTSVGYGASFGGVAALLSMLNSCAAGVGVVNIDNGYGAAALASRILKKGFRIR